MENLRALVYGRKLNNYQKALAKAEFEKLEKLSTQNALNWWTILSDSEKQKLLEKHDPFKGKRNEKSLSVNEIIRIYNKELISLRQHQKPDNRQLNTDDVNGSLHIEFAMYLCGHSQEDIEQMFNDWQQFQ